MRDICPARKLARDASAAGVPVYLYRFTHDPESAFLPGAFHTAELPYIFGYETGLAQTQPDEVPLRDAMQGYWTRFAARGDPNGSDAPLWPRYSPSADPSLALDLPRPAAEDAYGADTCDFWGALPD